MSVRCSSGWRRSRRAAELALAGVALAVGAPAAGAADVEFRATVSPDRVVFGETQALTYRVEMTTGAKPERFDLHASAGGAFGGEGTLHTIGGGPVTLEGPGTLAGPAFHHGDAFPCSSSELRERHGGQYTGARFGLELPAQSTSTLVFETSVGLMAPWPQDRYAAWLQASGGTLDRETEIPVAAPAPGGRTGVRLEIQVAPASGRICRDMPPPVDGEPITITGRSEPPLGGQQVLLRYVPPGQRAAVTLASVPVASDGTFSYSGWRPQESGVYEVAAEYTSQRPELTDDFSAPRVFELRVPAGEAPPPPEDQAAIPRGRIVARRVVRLAAGTRRTVAVRLRLRARDRRTLRRRGRLTVTAHAGAAARRVIIRTWPTR